MPPGQPGPDQQGAIWHLSPNSGPRRDGLAPSLIVVHYTAMDSAQAALERLCDPDAEVSAHYLIGAGGTLWQMVPEHARAWHAGAGEWRCRDDINSRSIGIELDNLGSHPFSAPQMDALEDLMRGIMTRWQIHPEAVIGHSCMAPGRKSDPGPRFDWARLARQGLAAGTKHAVPPADLSLGQFRQAARAAGFTAAADDEALLAAVRLRFRPWARGPLAPEDFTSLGNSAP